MSSRGPHAIVCEEAQREICMTRRPLVPHDISLWGRRTRRSEGAVAGFCFSLSANHEPPPVGKHWTISEELVAPSEAGALAFTSSLG